MSSSMQPSAEQIVALASMLRANIRSAFADKPVGTPADRDAIRVWARDFVRHVVSHLAPRFGTLLNRRALIEYLSPDVRHGRRSPVHG